MQSVKEEKQLENSLEALIARTQEIKDSIATFIMKLEHEYETLNWPSVLDNFALISGQINTLNRLLKYDKMPALRNHILLPLVLAPERDIKLEKLTEGRVVAFNHEVVPDYLRTKPEPEVEDKVNTLASKANTLSTDSQKLVNALNKTVTSMIDTITDARETWERESNQRTQQPQTSSQADTNTLISAVAFGKSLKVMRHPEPSQQMQQQPPPSYPRSMHGYYGGAPGTQVHMNKAQNTIKANIKAAAQHPYTRP